MRPLLSRAARLVAVARFEVEEYGEELRLPAEKFALIPNGTELAFADAGPPQRNGRPTFATIGRLERYKGHHRVLAALPEVLRLQPEAKLLIVGSGPYEEELRRQAAELGLGDAVEFTSVPGDRPEEMAELLRRVSLVVLLSEFETHPLVALEAAAAGCRLLVADTGGLSELAAEGFARALPLEQDPRRGRRSGCRGAGPAAAGQAPAAELLGRVRRELLDAVPIPRLNADIRPGPPDRVEGSVHLTR